MMQTYTLDQILWWLAWIHMGFIVIPAVIATVKIEWDAWQEEHPKQVSERRPLRERLAFWHPQQI